MRLLAAASILVAPGHRSGLRRQAPRARRVGACARDGASVVNLNTVAELPRRSSRRCPWSSRTRRSAGLPRARSFDFYSNSAKAAGRCRMSARSPRARAETGPPRRRPASLLTSVAARALKPSFTVRTREAFTNQVLLFGLLYVLGFHIVVVRLAAARRQERRAAARGRPSPDRDRFRGAPRQARSAAGHVFWSGRYTEGILLGLVLMTAVSLVDFRKIAFLELSYVPLLARSRFRRAPAPLRLRTRRQLAKVNLGPVQPIEAHPAAARALSRRLLRAPLGAAAEMPRTARSGIVRAARLDQPAAGRVRHARRRRRRHGAVLLLPPEGSRPGALHLLRVFLAIYAVARGRTRNGDRRLRRCSLLAFYVGHGLHVSQTLADRVSMWQSPWDNAVAGGDQMAHALWAHVDGRLGTGLGLGDTRYLPAGHTDLILAAIGEELGVLGLLARRGCFTGCWPGAASASAASRHNDYGFFLATDDDAVSDRAGAHHGVGGRRCHHRSPASSRRS